MAVIFRKSIEYFSLPVKFFEVLVLNHWIRSTSKIVTYTHIFKYPGNTYDSKKFEDTFVFICFRQIKPPFDARARIKLRLLRTERCLSPLLRAGLTDKRAAKAETALSKTRARAQFLCARTLKYFRAYRCAKIL